MARVNVARTNGRYLSSQLVAECPACSYVDNDGNLKFSRCSTDDGYGTWESTTVVSSEDSVIFTSLLVVRGNPAISFQLNGKLYYVRSDDKYGKTWGSPVSIIDNQRVFKERKEQENSTIIMNSDFADFSEEENILRTSLEVSLPLDNIKIRKESNTKLHIRGSYCCLKNINGNPTIVCLNETVNSIEYIPSKDCIGDLWNEPIRLNYSGTYLNLCCLNGYPTIIYHSNNYLYLIKSTTHFLETISQYPTKEWCTPIKLAYGGLYLSSILNNDILVISHYEPPELGKSVYKLHMLTYNDSPRYRSYFKTQTIAEDIGCGQVSLEVRGNSELCIIFKRSNDTSLSLNNTVLDNTTNIGDYISTIKTSRGEIGVFYIDYAEGTVKYQEIN